jgi:hypothetical protein
MWLGLPDVAVSTDAASAATAVNPELTAVLAAWDDWDLGLGIVRTARDLSDAANKTDRTGALANPELQAALAAVCPGGINARTIGYWLREVHGTYAGGVCVAQAGEDRQRIALWQLQRAPLRDTFGRLPIPDPPDRAVEIEPSPST